ncbi:MAG TPA: gephyrin-like molybdotransferase Glp [Azospirillaceae bacterium]|nr:gephyrin-like molybdotransferase Glp [Azospirillaceae bacterium]
MPRHDASAPAVPRTVESMLEAVLPTLRPVAGTEEAGLRQAAGRVLARDVVAAGPVPGFARSAVDGYALPPPEGEAGLAAVLPVRARVAAGDDAGALPPGPGAVRIFTGGAIPPGCDRVVMQEDCREAGGTVHVRAVPPAGANIRLPGDDLAAGAVALAAGTLLDPRHLAVAASLGLTALPVRRRPRVGVLSTGSELVEPGEALPPGRIYNSNRFLMCGLVEAAGMEAVDLGTVPDDPAATRAVLARAAGCDAIATSGGVSVGEEDHVRAAVEAVGGRIDHWKLAIKPGKPLAVGTLPGEGGREVLFLGLPGNPNAVFVTLCLAGLPLLRVLAGLPYRAPRTFTVRCAEGFRRAPGRREYVPVRLSRDADGIPAASRLGTGGSAQQARLAAADALMVVPAETGDVRAGDLLDAIAVPDLIRADAA